MNQQFTEEEIQMVHKHMQRCSSSQIIRDIQIKKQKATFYLLAYKNFKCLIASN